MIERLDLGQLSLVRLVAIVGAVIFLATGIVIGLNSPSDPRWFWSYCVALLLSGADALILRPLWWEKVKKNPNGRG